MTGPVTHSGKNRTRARHRDDNDTYPTLTTALRSKPMAESLKLTTAALRWLGGHSEGQHTRSHPELGRENPQRQWYCVLRRGRVGRCQAFQADAPAMSRQAHGAARQLFSKAKERKGKHNHTLKPC